MSRHNLSKLVSSDIDRWLSSHPGWTRVGEDAIARHFRFGDFSAALAFVVRVGCVAEKHNHHPSIELDWGAVRVLWTTHDSGGITERDIHLAELTDRMTSDSPGFEK